PWAIEHVVQTLVLERRETDLDPLSRKSRCPLLDAKSLTGRSVVAAGNDREKAHQFGLTDSYGRPCAGIGRRDDARARAFRGTRIAKRNARCSRPTPAKINS